MRPQKHSGEKKKKEKKREDPNKQNKKCLRILWEHSYMSKTEVSIRPERAREREKGRERLL